MGTAQIPLLAALTDKMRYHQTRQSLLAENVANAETPGYRARDMKAYSFDEHLRDASTATFTTNATNPGHIIASASSSSGSFGFGEPGDFETTPDGNAVNLEDEMMKVTANQMDYQAITTLYTRSLHLIRTALGRNG
jgi:flagellar basal-body rod protein FlgB